MTTVEFGVAGEPISMVTAIRRLRLLMEDQVSLDHVWAFVHEGPPVSKSRARWNRKNQQFYTPKETKQAEADLAWRFKSAMGGRVLNGNVAILAIFVRPDRQRIDADNLMKMVMDSATGAGVWGDDSQVTAQASYVELDAQFPRAIVALAETTGSLVRGPRFICVQCGEPFERGGANVRPQFCSAVCRSRAMSKDPGGPPLARPVACEQCAKPYARRTTAQRFCSESCRREWLRGRNRAAAAPNLCRDCGAPTPNQRAARCRACWLVSRSGS